MTNKYKRWCWHLGLASFLTISWVSLVTPNVVISAPDDSIVPREEPGIDSTLLDNIKSLIDALNNAAPGEYIISLISVNCNYTANIYGTDLISVEINGEPIWGPYPISATQIVNFNIAIPFYYSAQVEFFVHEADGSQTSIGSDIISARGSRPLPFERYGADYMVYYQTQVGNSY